MNELIICAANFYPTLGKIVLGIRHCDEFMSDEIEDIYFAYPKMPKEIQGFITNKKRFVDRKEAMKIAIENNQIKRLVGNQTKNNLINQELFSENLY